MDESEGDLAAVRHLVAVEAVEVEDPPAFSGWLQRMCRAAAREIPASGVGVSLISDDGALITAAASGSTSAEVEELQFTMGEGPCLEAYASRLPVLVSDLSQMTGTSWPGYARAAQARGVRAVFAFPLQTGRVRLGALDVYRCETGSLSTVALKLALVFADVALEGFLESCGDGQPLPERSLEPGIMRYEVYQAQGMVRIQLEVSMEEALLRLRAHAFATGDRLSKVADEVINRRLVLDRDS